MRRLTVRTIIIVFGGLLSTAGLAQSREQQATYCTSGDPNALDQKIAACTALISSGGESDANLAVEFNSRGNAYDDKNNYARAIPDYNEAIRHNSLFASAFLNRGLSYIYQHDYAQATADFNEAIRLNPQYAKAYLARSRVERVLGKTVERAADVARACVLDATMC